MKRLLVVAWVALLLFPLGVAAKPSSVAIVDYERFVYPWVKQQSPGSHSTDVPQTDPSTWVVNPTSCLWDADDRFRTTFNGFLNAAQSDAYLDPGAFAVQHECVISDEWYPTTLLAAVVYAPSPSLLVTIEVGGQAVIAVPARDGKDWIYRACTTKPNGSPYAEVADSNGGHGTRFDLAFTVGNPTSSRVRSIGGGFVAVLNRTTNRDVYCP